MSDSDDRDSDDTEQGTLDPPSASNGGPGTLARVGWTFVAVAGVVSVWWLAIVSATVVGHGHRRFGGKTKADIIAISSALDDYAINNEGRYPKGLEALITPDENGEAYLKQRSVPLDAWSNPYLYEAPVGGRDPAVYTLGRDGLPGGSGEDEDLSNLLLLGGDWSAR